MEGSLLRNIQFSLASSLWAVSGRQALSVLKELSLRWKWGRFPEWPPLGLLLPRDCVPGLPPEAGMISALGPLLTLVGCDRWQVGGYRVLGVSPVEIWSPHCVCNL